MTSTQWRRNGLTKGGTMKHRTKFDKSKCERCKYASKAGQLTICYVSDKIPATKRLSSKENEDRRGDDFYNCKLYERRDHG